MKREEQVRNFLIELIDIRIGRGSLSEAIDLLIRVSEFLLKEYQPERLNPGDVSDNGCDSLNSAEMQRGESEEVCPP